MVWNPQLPKRAAVALLFEPGVFGQLCSYWEFLFIFLLLF